ncbi:Retrovirus-related Pol polyprotein from transposon opus, partial [Dictyocoela muelleri]
MNFISYTKAYSISKHFKKCTPIKIVLGNGDVQSIDRYNDIELGIQQNSDIIFPFKFYLLKNLPCEAIIGLDFLKRHKSSIDIPYLTLKLDDHEISLHGYENNYKNKKNKIIENNVYKFIEHYRNNNPRVGEIPTNGHVINLIEDKIIKLKGYPVPLKHKENVEIHLKDLIANKIIRKSRSYFSSPAFVISKPDKTFRLVVDYRNLNNITQSQTFPYPKLRDQFFDLKESKYFLKIDLHSGYYQLKISEKDIHKTAFIINNNKFEFLRLPFGLKNAPFHFQQAMCELFNELH